MTEYVDRLLHGASGTKYLGAPKAEMFSSQAHRINVMIIAFLVTLHGTINVRATSSCEKLQATVEPEVCRCAHHPAGEPHRDRRMRFSRAQPSTVMTRMFESPSVPADVHERTVKYLTKHIDD